MKLLTQSSLYLATLSLFIFFLIGIAFYFITKKLSNDQIDTILNQERIEVLANPEIVLLANQAEVPFLNRLLTNEISSPGVENVFYDSTATSTETNQSYSIRCLKFYDSVQDQTIEFILYKSKLSSDKLVEQVTLTMTILAILFIIGLFLFNRFLFRRVWLDFFKTIRVLQKYVPDQEPLVLSRPEIDEFKTLNEEIEKMSSRVSQIYVNLKKFTSHTTHELQTPLAIIQSKSELLLQHPDLSQDHLKLISSISDSAKHLKQLNRTLSLLFQISNNQFPSSGTFPLSDGITKQLESLTAWIDLKELKVETTLDVDVTMPVNPPIGEILLQNLIKNAIVHNHDHGRIWIEVKTNVLSIRNNGASPNRPLEDFFEDFVKGENSRGLGLGLSLIKRICDLSGLQIQYEYANEMHEIKIKWR